MYSTDNPIEFLGVTGSPYTRKMLAYLRFRHLPYRLHIGTPETLTGFPKSKPQLLPTFFLPNAEGETEAVTDSTPLIRRFESEHTARATLPDDPATRFLQDIVEDYADEWVTKIMFHYRWAVPENAEFVTPYLIYWPMLQATKQMVEQVGGFFAKRQIDRLGVVGSNEVTRPSIENSYRRLLGIMDDIFARRNFLFGTRPSAADFALYGQLTQIVTIEPTSSALARQNAPRVRCWVDMCEDTSGVDAMPEGWMGCDELTTDLRPLFDEIGQTYAPFAQANAKAQANGETEVSLEIGGKPWVQNTFPYQAKCLRVLRQSFAALSASDQAKVVKALKGTGCEVFTAAP